MKNLFVKQILKEQNQIMKEHARAVTDIKKCLKMLKQIEWDVNEHGVLVCNWGACIKS